MDDINTMKVRASDAAPPAPGKQRTEFQKVCSALRDLWLISPWTSEKANFARDHDKALTITKIQD